MFKIALCDCLHIKTVVAETVADFLGNNELEIIAFDTPEALLAALKANARFDLTLINQNHMAEYVQILGGLNQISQRKQDNGRQMENVFGIMGFVADAAKEAGVMIQNILKFFRTYKAMYISVSFLTDKGMQNIDVADIVFFEFVDRKVKIKTRGGEYFCNESLQNVLSLVEKHDFHQPHKSFIVNFKYIVSIKNYNITMGDGSVIPLSQKKAKAFRRLYRGYLKG